MQPQQVIGRADHPVQARLLEAQVGEELVPVARIQLGDFALDGGADRHHVGAFALGELAHRVEVAGCS